VKLKTKMEGSAPVVYVEIGGYRGTTGVHNDDVRHDVAYAHALVMAMSESELMTQRIAALAFKRRAAELMREWGLGYGSR